MMKAINGVLALMFFMATGVLGQTGNSSITGHVKEVKPHFAGQQTIVVDTTELVLLTDMSDPSGNTFQVNKEFQDLLVKKDNIFVLNPKYSGKKLRFTYSLNGKGWKCINHVSHVPVNKAAKKITIKE